MAIKDLKAYRTNPFIKDLVYKTGKKTTQVRGNKAVVNVKTGEIDDAAEIHSVEYVDVDRFVKLYTADLKLLFSLSPSAMKIVNVVIEQMQYMPNDDRITLSITLVEDWFERQGLKPFTRQSFSRSVEEMIKKGFLAKTELYTDQYFINPAIFFNGDRVKLVKEYHITNRLMINAPYPPLNNDDEN